MEDIHPGKLSLIISNPSLIDERSERVVIPIMYVTQKGKSTLDIEMEVYITVDHLLQISSLIGQEECKRLKIKLVDF